MSSVLELTVEEKRRLQQRAVGVAACAAAAAYGAPQFSEHAAEQHERLAFLEHAEQLADALNEERRGETVIAALDVSKPWMQQVGYQKDNEPAQILSDEVQSFVDLISDLQPRMDVDDAAQQRRDHACLSEAIYYEARSEPLHGQLAVGEVVMNRVASTYYPDTVCDVVFQGSHRRTGCQFSFTCDGSMRKKPRGESWDRAKGVAAHVLMGGSEKSVTGVATHYHTNYVSPYWRHGLVHTETIGTHIFYRFPETGSEWAKARSRQIQARASGKKLKVIQTVSLTTEQLQARELARIEGRLDDKDV